MELLNNRGSIFMSTLLFLISFIPENQSCGIGVDENAIKVVVFVDILKFFR